MADEDDAWFVSIFNKKTKKWVQQNNSGMSKKSAAAKGKQLKKQGFIARMRNLITLENERF